MLATKVKTKVANWSAPTDSQAAYQRAGGRRGYNARRRFQADVRRWSLVLDLLFEYGLMTRGVLSRIARELGVSRSTVCRDRRALLTSFRPCPRCGAPVPKLLPPVSRKES
jgi:hypothetical protein